MGTAAGILGDHRCDAGLLTAARRLENPPPTLAQRGGAVTVPRTPLPHPDTMLLPHRFLRTTRTAHLHLGVFTAPMLRRVLLVLAMALPAWAAAKIPPTQVAVIATLHQLHATTPAYSFEALGRAIEQLQPDVLCVELQPDDLKLRPAETTKQEYPDVIYPLIDRHHYRVYAMEPAEPTYSDILKPYIEAGHDFSVRAPEQAEAFSRYSDGAYIGLQTYWTSPARVNDAVTDSVLRAKHELQQAMVGDGERVGWERWNRQFLGVILQAARENPGKRIVVIVGAEHGYWLRGHLAQVSGVQLLDTAELLRAPAAKPVQHAGRAAVPMA